MVAILACRLRHMSPATCSPTDSPPRVPLVPTLLGARAGAQRRTDVPKLASKPQAADIELTLSNGVVVEDCIHL